MGYFLEGLCQSIQGKIRPHEPKELMRVMDLTCNIEETEKEGQRYKDS